MLLTVSQVLASANPSRVYIRSEALATINTPGGTGTTIKVIETDVKPTGKSSTDGLYDMWSTLLPFRAFTVTSNPTVAIIAEVGGQEIITTSFFPTSEFSNCA